MSDLPKCQQCGGDPILAHTHEGESLDICEWVQGCPKCNLWTDGVPTIKDADNAWRALRADHNTPTDPLPAEEA